MNRTTAAVLLVALAAAAPAAAGEGRIPVWESTTITQPGHYILTRDLSVPPGITPIDILVGGVTLNLNGHTIVAQAPDPCISIGGVVAPERPVVVLGGKLQGGDHGIRILGSAQHNVVIRDVIISESAMAAVRADDIGALRAERVTILRSSTGFDLVHGGAAAADHTDGASITDSLIHANVGIHCAGLSCDVLRNTITSCATAVRFQDAAGGRASNNGVIIPGSNCFFNPQPEPPASPLELLNAPGVSITHNVIRSVPTAGTEEHGILVDATSHGAYVMDNSVSGAGDDGIRVLSDNSLVRGNLVTGSGNHGIYLGGAGNVAERNRAAGNAGDGLHVATMGQVYSGNVLVGNDGSSVAGAGLGDLVDGSCANVE